MSAFLLKNPDCVLIHIPKSAGRSIRKGVWNGAYDGPYFGPLPSRLKSYFKFAFVRNPYDRLASVWRMFSQGSKQTANYIQHWRPDPNLTINDILDITEDESIIYDERRRSFREIIRHHSIPMTHEFNAIDSADFIGRYENLEVDWKSVCDQIALPHTPLPRMMYTEQQDYHELFDEKTLERTKRVYAEDLERFAYEF